MKNFALIVAGGSGLRMGTDIPKQFLLLGTELILMHTIRRFKAFDADINIVLVLPKSQFSFWEEQCGLYKFNIVHELVAGGDSRFQSVRNGLQSIENNDGLVFIHDGVRPLVSIETIRRCETKAKETGSALPVINIVDSVRRIDDDEKSTHIDRSKYRLVQTPQTFCKKLIKEAYLQDESPFFTDDASVLESLGHNISLVEGNEENIKITKPTDLLIAELFLKQN